MASLALGPGGLICFWSRYSEPRVSPRGGSRRRPTVALAFLGAEKGVETPGVKTPKQAPFRLQAWEAAVSWAVVGPGRVGLMAVLRVSPVEKKQLFGQAGVSEKSRPSKEVLPPRAGQARGSMLGWL